MFLLRYHDQLKDCLDEALKQEDKWAPKEGIRVKHSVRLRKEAAREKF